MLIRFSFLWMIFCAACCVPKIICAQANGENARDSVFLRDIQIDGNPKTKKAVLLRELSVHGGDRLAKDSLESLRSANRLRLMTIQLFNDVKINWIPVSDDTVMMLIRVFERFPVMPDPKLEFADRNFNVWWNEMNRDLRRINVGLALMHRNFRGNREVISVLGQIGYTQKIGLAYERPYLDKQQKHGAGISFYGLQNREIPYLTDSNKLLFHRSSTHAMLRQTEAGVWYTYRPAYATTHKVSLLYQHYWVSDTIVDMNPEYLGDSATQEDVFTLSYQFRYNNVDNWEYPLHGSRLTGSWSNKYGTGNKNFQSSLYLQYDLYWNPWKKWYVSSIFRGRVSLPAVQPYIFRRNLGYDFDYVRGYEYYVIDGSAFGLVRLNLKRELLNVQFKLPVRYFQVVPLRIYAKAYADAGYGYNAYPYKDYLHNKMLYAGGIGIEVVTFYDIKLRFEYTINGLGEKDLYLHKSGE